MGFFGLFGSRKKKLADFTSRGAIILDVRSKSEYEVGAIPGSELVPLQQLSVHLSKVKSWNKPVITCCASGVRSATAASILRSNGVEAMNGGGWSSLYKKLEKLSE
ncbi:MAG: rhodanese-like domain-containing protein [Bacteroidota bacterium]